MSTNIVHTSEAAPGPSPRDRASTHDERPNDRARLNRIAIAVLVALALAFALAVHAATGLGGDTTSTDDGGARLGGDFPAFYAAGSIILDGDHEDLYVAQRQQLEQREFGVDGYLAFAYPPHVAAAYAPLAALGFRAAYAIHTLLMAGALIGALALLRKPVPLIAEFWLPMMAATLSFYPLFRAVGGGQNTALTVLVFAGVWRALYDENEVVAGLVAGLLLYRPQYALPLMCLFVVSRNVQAAASTVVVGLATWAATATVMGDDWLYRWVEQVRPFIETDAEVNAGNSISILGFLQALLGESTIVALVVGGAGAVAVALFLAWCWRNPAVCSLAQRMGITAVGVLLISPHTMFYDAGLMVIAGAALLSMLDDSASSAEQTRTFGLIALVWVAVLVHPVTGGFLPATPLAVVVAGIFVVMAVALFRSRLAVRAALANPDPRPSPNTNGAVR